MTPEQRGYYVQMVVRAWDEDYGRLQNDPHLLWQYAGAKSREEFERPLRDFGTERVCDLVIAQFAVRGKKLCNERLLVERHKQLSRSDAQRDKAKTRWDKAKKVKKIDAVAMPDEKSRHGSGSALPLQYAVASAITSTKQESTPSVATAPVDSRHSRIREMVQNAWLEHNPGLPSCPWSGRAAKELQTLLKETPGWHDSHYAQCLVNVYASHGFPRGSPPHDYIRKLPKYMQGPLNEFGKAIIPGGRNGNGNSNKTEARTEHNLRVAREVASELGLTKEPPRATGIDGGGDAGAVTILGRAEAVPR